MEEIEIKFLEVDIEKLEQKLKEIGAIKVKDYFYQIALFDYPDFRLDENHSWVRLRSDGEEVTLTYKQRIGVKSDDASISDEGMKEVEVVVGDYKKTYEILKLIGLVVKREEEKKRIRYKKGDVEFDIDTWPEIPSYLEIEGNSIEEVDASALELGFDLKDKIIGSAKQIYQKYGIDKNEYSFVLFSGMIKK